MRRKSEIEVLVGRLRQMEACGDAQRWCARRPPRHAWESCDWPYWQHWLLSRLFPDDGALAVAVARAAGGVAVPLALDRGVAVPLALDCGRAWDLAWHAIHARLFRCERGDAEAAAMAAAIRALVAYEAVARAMGLSADPPPD